MAYSVIGRDVPRVDAVEKLRGSPCYVVDMELPGMLHVAVLRSPLPHARVLSIDTSRAAGYPDVVRALTGAEIAKMPGIDPWFGPAFKDQAILAIDKVRYVGDVVAAVVAQSRAAAEEAVELIQAEYDPLPAVFDPVLAARPDAPLVHEELRPAKAFADLAGIEPGHRSNVNYHFTLRRGDVDAAMTQADHVFEDVFSSPTAQHAQLEPHATVAALDRGGKLNVWSSTQSPSFVRSELSSILGLPLHRVRVQVPYLGGAFGAKLYDKLEPLTALLALLTRRPVKWVLSRPEEFVTITKHAVQARIKTGVRQDGTIVARECEVWWDTGAYADIGPRVVHKSGYTAAGPYNIPNVRLDSYCVYTNKPPAGALRGFGVPQVVFPYESQMDMIADRLGLDPLELRLRNALHEGDLFATGSPMHSAGIEQSLKKVAHAIGWEPRPPRQGHQSPGPIRKGRGLAVGMKAVLTPSISEAIVEMNEDGSVVVLCSTVEMGQGSDTILAQIAAEQLGVTLDQVRLVHPDTDVTPYDTITAGSRSTYHMGIAIQRAADEVKRQLLETAADLLEAREDQLDLRDGRVIVKELPERRLSISEVFLARMGAKGTTILGHATFIPAGGKMDHETGQSAKVTAFWFVGATAAEIEVDVETGKIMVTKLACAADVGQPILPHHCKQQIIGAATMALGHTFFEQVLFDGGQVTNPTFLEYNLPSYLDVPENLTPIIVAEPHSEGPFGAKGVGETGTLSVSSAIANAVFDATGLRIRDLPLTAERVLRGLRSEVLDDNRAGRVAGNLKASR